MEKKATLVSLVLEENWAIVNVITGKSTSLNSEPDISREPLWGRTRRMLIMISFALAGTSPMQ